MRRELSEALAETWLELRVSAGYVAEQVRGLRGLREWELEYDNDREDR